MKIKLDSYKWEKTLIPGVEVELPEKTTYWFETGIRRAIRIVPVWTSWKMEQGDEAEEIYEYHITCVYRSWENKIESFSINVNNIATMWNEEKNDNPIKALIKNELDERDKRLFENDLNSAISELNKHENGQ